MTRKELLAVPKREWDEKLTKVRVVYILPSRRKHDSGYSCMDFVAETPNGLVGFGGCCDDVCLSGEHFRIDCEYPSGIIRIWNSHNRFTISSDSSSIDFVEEG